MPDPQQGKKQRKSSGRNSITVSNKERERSETTNEANEVSNKEPHKEPKKRGRKIKYTTDEERKEARRQQNRNYRARRRDELIRLRRQNVMLNVLEE